MGASISLASTACLGCDAQTSAAVVSAGVVQQLDGCQPALALLFVCGLDYDECTRLVLDVGQILRADQVIAVSAAGVIGSGREFEGQRAVSVLAIAGEGLSVDHALLDQERIGLLSVAHGEALDLGFQQGLCLLFADPASIDVARLLRAIDFSSLNAPIFGGLIGGGRESDDYFVCFNGVVHTEGALVLHLNGPFRVRSLVAQACRPVGEPMFVTGCDGRVVRELDGRPPLRVIEDIYRNLPRPEQLLMRSQLLLGIEINPISGHLAAGDFVVRQIAGVHDSSGHLVVAAEDLHETSVVQFQIRDGDMARRHLLRELRLLREAEPELPVGGLLFSCVGRGQGLFRQVHYESRLIASQLGRLPTAGMFCHGEIAPVLGQTLVHGYTSCLVLFYVVD